MVPPEPAAGSALGALAVHPVDGTLFIWSCTPAPGIRKPKATPAVMVEERTESGDPTRSGDGGLDIPGATPIVSTLYEWRDGTWTRRLVAKGETGAFVHVTPYGDLYASTNLPGGGVRIYHLSKTSATVENLPEDVLGPAGPFVGDDVVFVRAGGTVLGRHEDGWKVEVACKEASPGGAIGTLAGEQLIAACSGHDHFYDGDKWSTRDKWLPEDAHCVWGGRDVTGRLHLFAGSGAVKSGLRIWQFVEEEPGTLKGDFQVVFEDPAATAPESRTGGFWGTHLHEVYVTGVAAGAGRLYRFNGSGWVNAAPAMTLGTPAGFGVAPGGDLYLSLADGTLLRRPAITTDVEPTPRPRAALAVKSAPGPQATLEFTLPGTSDVSLEFFDPSGRRVDAIRAGRLAEGVHRLTWSADRLASGVYFCRLDAGESRIAQKVLIRK